MASSPILLKHIRVEVDDRSRNAERAEQQIIPLKVRPMETERWIVLFSSVCQPPSFRLPFSISIFKGEWSLQGAAGSVCVRKEAELLRAGEGRKHGHFGRPLLCFFLFHSRHPCRLGISISFCFRSLSSLGGSLLF